MGKIKEIYMYLLGAFVVSCAITIVGFLIFNTIPEFNKDIVNISLGAILNMAGSVVGYFFGSSKSSADKTEHIKNMQSAIEKEA